MSIKKKLGSILLSVGVFSSLLGPAYAKANALDESEVVLTQNMGKQIANDRLMINNSNIGDSSLEMYHYSHQSHASHYSHVSHYSHYSAHY